MAILGDNTAGADTFPCSSDRCVVSLFVLSEAATINSGGAYFDSTSAAGTSAKLVILNDSSGTPGTLVTSSSASAVPASGGLVTFGGLSGSLSIGSYWIGVVTNGSDCVFKEDASGGTTRMADGTFSYASPPATWPGTSGSYTSQLNAYIDYTPSSVSTDQEGARFRNDDGSETTATWAASQDSNITKPLGANLRTRFLINAAGDPASAAYTLYYKKSTSGTYIAVPTASATSPTLSYGTAGAVAYSASGGTSVAPAYPTGITSNSGLVLVIGQKPSTANSGTVTTPSGWTLQTSRTGANDGNTGGYTTTLGADTGNCNIFVYTKDTVSGSESGSLSVTIGTNNVSWGVIIRVQASDAGTWSWVGSTGKDTTAGNVSIATGSLAIVSGDFVVGGMVIPTDVTTPSQFSAESFTQSGTTFGSATEIIEPDSTTGNDIGGFLCYAAVSSGSGSGAVTLAATAGGTTTNVRGPGFVLRARVSGNNNPVYVSASSNITAGGEATTAQLTAPSGKATSDFDTGRMWDNENGSDSIDITTDNYTELEWCLQAQSPAANGDIYQFRVYSGSTPLTTYSVTPEWTIGSGVTNYDFNAETGSYSSTGVAGTVLFARNFNAEASSFTYTGVLSSLSFDRTLNANSGTYTLSGVNNAFVVSYLLNAQPTSFSVSGNAATVLYDRVLTLNPTTYAINGVDANFFFGYGFIAESGSYSLTGVNNTNTLARLLQADTGSYALSGFISSTLFNRLLNLESSSYSYTGNVGNLLFGRSLNLEPTTFSVSGVSASLLRGLVLTGDAGTYTLSGVDADLSNIVGYFLNAEAGSYVLNGVDTEFSYSGLTSASGLSLINITSLSSGASIGTEELDAIYVGKGQR